MQMGNDVHVIEGLGWMVKKDTSPLLGQSW